MMRMTTLALGLILSLVAAGLAQTPKPVAPASPEAAREASPRDADAAAIRANDAAFIKAFNAGDAAALAATFTEDAEVIDEENTLIEGRAAIADRFQQLFAASPGAKIALSNDAVKFLGKETAIVRGRAVVTQSDGEAESSLYSVVFVKEDGAWLQASTRDEADDAASPADRLKPLDWLVGEWVSENSDSVVTWDCSWADNKSSLVLAYEAKMAGKPGMKGSLRIGWDPLTRHVKSWMFDSEGGHGEGDWSNVGAEWMVKARGVSGDGRPASATQHVTRLSKDMVKWVSIDRTVGGQIAPDFDEFIMVRKPPKPR